MPDDALLDLARRLAGTHLHGLPDRHVGGSGEAPGLVRALTDAGEDPARVLEELAADAGPALVASPGPRYFGFVTGGALPVALAADWLVSAWDQNAFSSVSSPAAAVAEEVAAGWALELLGLPAGATVGFTTGAQTANLTALLAARDEVLRRHGHDVAADGLSGAPAVDVLVGEEVHATVLAALRMTGLGEGRATRVAVDADGAMDPAALADALAARAGDGPAIVCAQAGNVNTGACDPLEPIAAAARAHGAWLHVDGAFGLWAAASPRFAHLVAGRELADSWAVDAHKWLNVPYDCALAIVADRRAHTRAMTFTGAYTGGAGPVEAYAAGAGAPRQASALVPEASRRARAIPVYAALRTLGRDGVAALVERTCDQATLMATRLQEGGMEVLNAVVLNQVLVATTPEHVARIQADGTTWLGGSVWRGRDALRVACSNWSTTRDDIERSARAILSTR